jgi:hypothetical protein
MFDRLSIAFPVLTCLLVAATAIAGDTPNACREKSAVDACCDEQPPSQPDPRVAAVTTTRAATVDASLPADVTLDVWLREVLGAGASLSWRISDCDLKPDVPEPAGGHPLCVAADASTRDRIGVRLHFRVGSTGVPATHPPRLEQQSFASCGRAPQLRFGAVGQLRDLPRVLAELRAANECAKR